MPFIKNLANVQMKRAAIGLSVMAKHTDHWWMNDTLYSSNSHNWPDTNTADSQRNGHPHLWNWTCDVSGHESLLIVTKLVIRHITSIIIIL